jgi:hypothetical protein
VVCLALGIYMIVGGVYLGWWTPATALERAFQPNLSHADAWVTRVEGDDVIFRIGVVNTGRDNLDDAIVTVSVPDFVSAMQRCSADGVTGLDEHRGSFWREGERFWNGNVSFPGRITRLIFFRVALDEVRNFSVRLQIYAPALNDLPDVRFDLSVAEPTRPTEQPALAEAPETSGQGS